MQRLAIYVFYDEYGIVDDYVIRMLESLKKVVRKRVVVVNGFVTEEGRQKLKSVSECIYVRENRGYDWGAYKDAVTDYLKEELFEYNELLLLNNSFIGPFFPWNIYFDKFSLLNIDFWGITRWGDNGEDEYPDHIQSYFFVLKHEVFTSEVFARFMQDIEYKQSFDELVSYEINFTEYLVKNGFKYSTIMDEFANRTKIDFKEIKFWGEAYNLYPYQLVKNYCVPILKITAISPTNNYVETIQLIDFLRKNDLYDINIIKNYIDRIDGIGRISKFGFKELKEFSTRYSKIYLYGNGIIGRRLRKYLELNNIKVEGIIVTKKGKKDGEIIEWENFKPNKDAGVIIAVGKSLRDEIGNIVIKKVPKEQILFPHDMRHWDDENGAERK